MGDWHADVLSYFLLQALGERYSVYNHFTDENTEAKRGFITVVCNVELNAKHLACAKMQVPAHSVPFSTDDETPT